MLPPLNKLYKRSEAKIDTPVLEWFANNYPYSVAIEVKVGKGKLLPHQELALNEVQDGEFYYKIPDMGRKNPFDGFVLKGAHAFKVVCTGKNCRATRIDDHVEFDFKL